jgi:hypothetical protein
LPQAITQDIGRHKDDWPAILEIGIDGQDSIIGLTIAQPELHGFARHAEFGEHPSVQAQQVAKNHIGSHIADPIGTDTFLEERHSHEQVRVVDAERDNLPGSLDELPGHVRAGPTP